jgi:hypothetical protein
MSLLRWFKQFERVAVRIVDLNLTSAWTRFHVISKGNAIILQGGDAGVDAPLGK